MLKSVSLLSVILYTALLSPPAMGSGHYEDTVVPIGSVTVERGAHDVKYKLPMGPTGPLPQAFVIIASQPWHQFEAETPVVIESTTDEELPTEQVPGTLKLTLAGKQLPTWTLQPYPTAYIINLQSLRASPEYQTGGLALNIELESMATGLNAVLLGMPDPLLANDSTNGLLADLAASASDADVKAYLTALRMEIGGDKEFAEAEYRKLKESKNARVARFARRGLRLFSHDHRPHPLTGNFLEHYRWALYLQQCGLFSRAFDEFEECRIIVPEHGESQFRAGEIMQRRGAPLYKMLHYMDRTGEAAKITNPVQWSVLVVILKSRDGKTLTPEEIGRIKDRCFYVERMIWAATGGNVYLQPTFHEVKSEEQQAYVVHEGLLRGPADDVVSQRGWFDIVFSVQPRLEKEAGMPCKSVGGNVGPNGAGLCALFHDAPWQDYLYAWMGQEAWATSMGETGIYPPFGDEAAGFGHQPIPDLGYGLRAALHYYIPEAMHRRAKISDVPRPGTHVQLWKIEGPYPVNDKLPAKGHRPGQHVMDPIPTTPAPKTVPFVCRGDFVDLAKILPNAGWARARATSWVFSPKHQEVRMWLGQNDGAAVWLNGRCIRTGKHYASAKYEDKNLTDTVAVTADLKRGWNELQVVVESWPAPYDKGWGFSVRFCSWSNQPILGLACVYEQPEKDLAPAYTPPKFGPYYHWRNVQHDFQQLLPRLTEADLEAITGIKGFRITGQIEKQFGHILLSAPTPPEEGSTYRALAAPWKNGQDRDQILNNVLDWERESCAAYRHLKAGKPRDLLLLRPEAVEAFLTLLDEPLAGTSFGKLDPADRLLGYVLISAGDSAITLLVVETVLGDKHGWPQDEEDLLYPISEEYIPNSRLFPETEGPPAPSR